MVKSLKKRLASESEAVEKIVQESENVNKSKKKKTENGSLQNGQTNKLDKKKAAKKAVDVKKSTSDSSEKNDKKAELVQKRLEYRAKRKEERKKHSQEMSPEDLKRRIEDIEKRENLSKSAKRKLATLRKLLVVKGGVVLPKKQSAKKQVEKASEKKKQVQVKQEKKKIPEKVESKPNKENKKTVKQGNLLLTKQKNEAEVEDDEDDDDDEEEVEVDNDESEDGDEDDESVEEEEEDEDEEEDDDEDDDEDEGESLEEEEDDNEESENEEEQVKLEAPKLKEKQVKSETTKSKEKPQQTQEQDAKKKRYVLFVGNLPYDVTSEEIEKHFLSKVSQVVSVRIPKKPNSNESRGFAYVELSNNTDYEKALLLNHSFVKGRRINVQYSTSDKKESVAKNFKLHALQKSGKLAGGRNKNFQKNFNRKGGKPYMQKTKT